MSRLAALQELADRLVARGVLRPDSTFTACSIQERRNRMPAVRPGKATAGIPTTSVDETTAGAARGLTLPAPTGSRLPPSLPSSR